MKALKGSLKTLTGAFGVFSVIALAGTMTNINLYSDNFSSNEEVVFVSELDDSYTRVVASYEQKRPQVAIRRVTSDLVNLINGKWEIVRFTNAKGYVEFDKINREADKKALALVDLEAVQVSNSIRMIKGNEILNFKLSYINEAGTIALVNKVGDGYESIEARKVRVVAANSKIADSEQSEEEKINNAFSMHSDTALKLYSALNFAKSREIIRGGEDTISGSANITNGVLGGLTAFVRFSDDSSQTAELSEVDITPGKTFMDGEGDDAVSGAVARTPIQYFDLNEEEQRITKTVNGFSISFLTGDNKGLRLNFVSEEDHAMMLEAAERVSTLQEEYQKNEEKKDSKVIEDQSRKRDIANEAEEKVEKRELNEDEVSAIFEKSGFDFGTPTRSIASQK